MNPVSPVVPGPNLPELQIAKDQPQYRTLPAVQIGDGVILTRWELSPEEVVQLRRIGQIDLFQWTGGARPHPTLMLLDPVLDAKLWDVTPPVKGNVYVGEGCFLSIHWLDTSADVEKAIAQGYVYLVIWHGRDLIQPMIFDVDLNRTTQQSRPEVANG
jgi:hypothetical protein